MDDKKDRLAVNLAYDEAQTIPLALHEMHMARADRRIRNLCVCWAALLLLAIGAFIFLWLQYDYAATEEYSGVYVLSDSLRNSMTMLPSIFRESKSSGTAVISLDFSSVISSPSASWFSAANALTA